MRVLLIRHGESTGNAQKLWGGITDHELTIHGIAQAASLGRALQNEPLTHIYSSPLQRARDTALAIKQHHTSTHWQVFDEIKEQNLGSAEGKPWKTGRGINGETRLQMASRAQKFVEFGLYILPPSAYVAVVSHGLFLATLVQILRLSERGFWSNTGFMDVEIQSTSKPLVRRINETSHLKGLKKARCIGSAPHDKKQRRIKEYFTASQDS